MGKVYELIDDRLREWIERQHIFFVATAAASVDSSVNLSPKGMSGTFAVLGPTSVAYLDLTGSGIETVAHLRENGRITLMWCAFDGSPRIVRIHGTGTVVTPGEDRWGELAGRFDAHRGQRAVIVVDAGRISDSCGYSIPLMEFAAERSRLTEWADNRSDEELSEYRARKNAASIDGLPGLPGV